MQGTLTREGVCLKENEKHVVRAASPRAALPLEERVFHTSLNGPY